MDRNSGENMAVVQDAGRVNEAPAGSGGSILVVDDEEQIRKLVSLALRRAGYEVILATNGQEALERLSEALPDLIISDVMMPEMDGLALLTHLRSDPITRVVPLILLTAKGTTDDIVSGMNLGADDYLAKPFEMRVLLARVKSKIERPPVPSELITRDRQTGLLNERRFMEEVTREMHRTARGGAQGCLAYLSLEELPTIRERLGARAEAEIAKQVTAILLSSLRPLDMAGRLDAGRFGLLLPENTIEKADHWLVGVARQIAAYTFTAIGEHVRLTPAIGYLPFSAAQSVEQLRERAFIANHYAAVQLDLKPVCYSPSMDPVKKPKIAGGIAGFVQSMRMPFQIIMTQVLSLCVPFVAYLILNSYGIDITPIVYLAIVIALFITAYFIWVEGFLALKPVQPPAVRGTSYPPASAIIAAYLPNEAATIVETVETFLRLDYPGKLQIILAYNTPRSLPVEAILQEIARRDPRFVPLHVTDSVSKAQNVNAALGIVEGEFTGIFDADHHPQPDSFTRAWRWLSNGYDIVQGHCQVRNGDESWVAKMVAVEFEAIYAVSHPGRARLHNFGIFGGSNGFWKTDLLRQTRMHGFMLTEDIDSSMRVIESGWKIASDPHLISRELAPVTMNALWNQRMRWAQGWFQVTLKHFWQGMWSGKLSPRQKFGLVHLLAWREVYPWITSQILPIILFWSIKYQGVDKLDWFVPIFVLTTVFTLSVGPGQTLFSYLLAAPEIRRHKRWFAFYFAISVIFYTTFKNVITLMAQLKEIMHDRQWKVTPRQEQKA